MYKRAHVSPQLIQVTREKQNAIYVVSPELRETYAAECKSCGACCSRFFWDKQPENSVDLSAGEVRQKNLWHWVQQVSLLKVYVFKYAQRRPALNRMQYALRKIRNAEGWWTCAALRGKIGEQVSCAVYDRRPETCRAYAPGGESCQRVRTWAGLPKLEVKTDG